MLPPLLIVAAAGAAAYVLTRRSSSGSSGPRRAVARKVTLTPPQATPQAWHLPKRSELQKISLACANATDAEIKALAKQAADQIGNSAQSLGIEIARDAATRKVLVAAVSDFTYWEMARSVGTDAPHIPAFPWEGSDTDAGPAWRRAPQDLAWSLSQRTSSQPQGAPVEEWPLSCAKQIHDAAQLAWFGRLGPVQ